MIAREALSSSTTATEAAKAAKQLVGSYAHLRPADPATFVESIAAVLAQYPLGLVLECVDPQRGAARKIEFLSVAHLVAWLDGRLEYHQAMAAYVPRSAMLALPRPQHSPEHRATMMERWRGLVTHLMAAREDPITRMRRQARINAQAQLDADKARALTDLAASESVKA